jgi:hypothetical protein
MEKSGAHSAATPWSALVAPPALHMAGRKRDILIAFDVMTVPMVLFAALLLGLMFHFRIVYTAFISDNLVFDSGQDASDVFFIRISATTLITIALWSSTVSIDDDKG